MKERKWWNLDESWTVAELLFAAYNAECKLSDKLLDAADNPDAFEYDKITSDYYDTSIELKGVSDDVRLNEAQQRLISEAGFSRCWLCHKDGWETFYWWPEEFKPLTGSRNNPSAKP